VSRPDTLPADPRDLLELAARLARAGGGLALEGRRRAGIGVSWGAGDDDPAWTKSSATDMVTTFDRAAERRIVEILRLERPDDGFVGEEGTAFAGSSGLSWLVDPIDGTTNFVYDLPSWSTSVAVAFGDEMVAGAVYVPVTDELYAASAGGGATLDGRAIGCSSTADVSLALVATGFGYRSEVRSAQARRLAGLIGQVRDVRRLGSAAIDLCHVAAGRVDVYFEEHLNAWDAAAGELIAREAGCVTSDFSGGPARPAELVAAPPQLHRAVLDLIAATAEPTGRPTA
jgi:myo-inositol-1(or 4)-monophosphatase